MWPHKLQVCREYKLLSSGITKYNYVLPLYINFCHSDTKIKLNRFDRLSVRKYRR